ncbi:cobalt ECF transporter T component CbiQ [Candidatus Solincola tengchongensis]|uniref:cobalt ECF transporter T component CbiQ n=1 Tax=Candidatus Solincola tengchongensis TaxID=2900693 RepID=UPI002580D419|nr:cobalt ECF transporter T component CbiQ [Candidatus Solincola tengchongensis]
MKHAFLDRYSHLESPVHRLDPRAKLVGFATLVVVCVTTPPHLYAAFVAYLGLEAALIVLSRLPWKHVLKRLLVVLPFIMVVAAFIPFFSKGGGSYNLGPVRISGHGLLILWNVAAKSTVSVLAVIILSSTTPFSDLLGAMEKMRVPRLFTSLLSFTYRYIFVLVDEAQRMRRARDSRGWSGKWLWQAKVVGHMIAALFLRSYERGERVYAAMLARGYGGGGVRTFYAYELGILEAGFAALVALFPLAARLLS